MAASTFFLFRNYSLLFSIWRCFHKPCSCQLPPKKEAGRRLQAVADYILNGRPKAVSSVYVPQMCKCVLGFDSLGDGGNEPS